MQKEGKPTEENAPPGTVVDTDIVHPTQNDFFLLSHQGINVNSHFNIYFFILSIDGTKICV